MSFIMTTNPLADVRQLLQEWPDRGGHIIMALESLHIQRPDLLQSDGVGTVAVAYQLLPARCCPPEVQRTAQLTLNGQPPHLPCNHAMVSTFGHG